MNLSEWLPDNALVAPGFLATIDARVEAWSARWFGERAVRRYEKLGSPTKPASALVARHRWRGFEPGIWFDWGPKTAQTLALQALDHADLHPKLTDDDEHLLVSLGERIASDLAASLAGSPARTPATLDEGPDKVLNFRLGNASQALNLTAAIDRALLARLRKQQAPAWRPRAVNPQPISIPLADVPVTFEAILGSARMSLLEFEGVEPGDTIVLDQRMDDPIVLRGSVTDTPIGSARLVCEDGQFLLAAS